ncbi:SDR family NAD(P)-dependent oxidoreductase, partial [Nonomuraea angiospora]|uniref:SDR family NAD(P)-dependent oxidoreductase n=1 Tax=Nonomuraea angiospora TaxID=46172 RepID=UPI0033E61820
MSQSGNSEFEASGTPTTRAGRATAFTLRLADLSMAERRASLIELVSRTTLDVMSAVLPGLLETVSAEQTFKDMGLDSLAAVELHDRLAAELGAELPIGIAFDYPTPAALADYLLIEALGLGERRTAEITAAVGSDEPIAIVGMACRYPGGVATPEELWELITEGRETVTGFPTDRGWDLDRLFDDDPDAGNTTYARVGHFLHDAAEFDAAFFGISPREAVAMDPQQRLILETCWEAVERAGINPQTLHQSQTGVFIGAEPQDYGPRLHQAPPDVEGYLVTGAAPSVVAGRVAYTLGLEGPAVTVDTACSASLVAIHLACQSLRTGESPLVLAGGVTVMSAPGTYTAFSRQRVIAADGRCKAFSSDADGTGFSEGVGVLVLERLSDAVAAGHRVLGVIRGSAVNQDGASNGLTAPNGPSQERVIRQALANAGLSGAEVDAVEAHGTGTALGDPIEAQALLATYGRDRESAEPLWLGSLKSNIGHTQAAAGVAGVIKMVLAMRHGLLPRTLHVSAPTTHVDWEQGQVRLLEQAREWPEPDGRPRRAGVSSFGVSGTNSHVIVEQAPEPQLDTHGDAPVVSGVVPWVLSGRGEEALRAQASRLAEYVGARPGVAVEGVGLSLVRGRAAFEDRAVVVGADREELLGGLRALAAGESDPGVVFGTASGRRDAVLVFPGQGAQWAGMGVELAQASPVFAARLEECFTEIRRWVDWDPAQVLADADGLESIERLQPVAFAVGVALAALWESVGVRPTAVVGHSQGEVAAACVAGVLSLADAVRVVVLRSRLFAAELWGRGAIAAVGLPAEMVRERVASLGGGLEVSADNGPASCAVAGPTQALEELVERLRGEGVRARVIATTVASHSQMVEPLREQLLEMLGPITPEAGRVPVYSTVTGGVLAGSELGAEYWFANARRPVDFQGAVRALLADGRSAFIEVSPHPVLTMAVQDILDATGTSGVAVGSLRRGEGGPDRFMRSAGEAFAAGVGVDWLRLLPGTSVSAELPTYAFQHQRYWLESAVAGVSDADGLGQTRVDHPMLGAAVELPDHGGVVLTGRISTATHPWLADHGVGQTVIFPGTGFVELVVRAGDEVGCPVLEELTLEAPLVIEGDEAVQLQVAVAVADEDGRREVAVHARTGRRPWTRHAAGTLTATSSTPSPAGEQWPPAGAQSVDVSGHYETLAGTGYGYGPAFQGLKRAWIRDDEVFAEVELDEREAAEAGGYGIHPALLDAALHATGLIEQAEGVALPFAWNGVELLASGAQRVRVHAQPTDDGATSIHITDTTGAPVAIITSLISRPLPAGGLSSRPQAGHDALHRVQWVPLPGELVGSGDVAVVGEGWPGLVAAVQAAGGGVGKFVDVAALGDAVASGRALPAAVVMRLSVDAFGLDGLRPELDRVVGVLSGWLADERLTETRLVLVTSGAVTTGSMATGLNAGADGGTSHAMTTAPSTHLNASDADGVDGVLIGAAVSGLVRSAQAENPGRILLVDLDDAAESLTTLASLLGVEDEPQLAVRAGQVLVPRLARADSSGDLVVPDGSGGWRLDCPAKGSLEELALIPAPEVDRELAAGEVRVDVRAAGLNFRDVVVALGMVPEQGEPIGGEFAGVVSEVGPGVEGVRVGDRVMGLGEAAFGPRVVVDQRLLAGLPAGWSFAQGAGVTVAFATAWYGLVDLAGLSRGERVLIHSGAGGVGMAAIQIARHLGAEVFATASPAKQHLLRALGVADDHIASSRDLDFADAFATVMGGAGMDVVLNSLAGPFTDASLDLLTPGGRFIELGKTDRRDPAQVAGTHPQVRYRSFDLMDAGHDRIGQMLAELLDLFTGGGLAALPVRCWPVQQARQAFRHMAQARHTGKIILTMPRSLDPNGTVLITGGTGGLGAILARHLATGHQVKRLLLASRRGDQAPDADQLRADLETAGATVEIAACDLSDPEQVATLLDRAPALTAVFHTAGVLDDGVVTSLTPDKIDRVLRPKADAAWHLHQATRHLDLAAFVLYSSSAATLDSAGQGNYSAANAFLDALAIHRHTTGLPAQALAWGLWHQPSGMSAHLTTTDITRIEQAGYHRITTTQGNQLLDTALTTPQPHLLPLPINTHTLSNRDDGVPAILRGLARTPARRTARAEPVSGSGSALERRLTGLPAAEQEHVLVSLVCAEAAAVLGHASGEAIQAGRPFKDLGFDSLTSVELRNRLSRAAGMKLPATLVFDHPTPTALAAHLLQRVTGSSAPAVAAPVRAASTSTGIGEPIAIVAMSCRYPGGVNSPEDLWDMLVQGRSGISSFPEDRGWDLEGLYDPDPDHVGTTYLREGGFLKDAAGFDAAFFGISPREAIAIDPQQRLLLETSWEVLERAGIDPDRLRGTPTGVFIGGTHTGYGADSPSADVEGYLVTGTSSSVMSGRVSYNFGLEGPALTVDTACSSSLVAIHLACESLRRGESTLALAGGVTVLPNPELLIQFSRQRGLARDGRCKAFSDEADGTVFSEGVGIL